MCHIVNGFVQVLKGKVVAKKKGRKRNRKTKTKTKTKRKEGRKEEGEGGGRGKRDRKRKTSFDFKKNLCRHRQTAQGRQLSCRDDSQS